MKEKKLNILFAGGTTGGHLFPAIALAHEFLSENRRSNMLFVSTGRPLELNILKEQGFSHKKINASGIKGLSLFKKLISLFKLPFGVLSAVVIISRFKPNIIIGVGGFSSAPVIMAGYLLRKRIFLHEQNLLPGIANKVMGRFADKIYVSFEETKHYFDKNKTILSGNPVRREFINKKMKTTGKESSRLNILITGGSQGANGINHAVADSLPLLKNKEIYSFIHQAGEKDVAFLKEAYRANNIKAEVISFITDMPDAFQKANLIVARSGALTVSEIMATGKPALFIPFPQAADNHQFYNAKPLADAGAALIIEENKLNGTILAEQLTFFEKNRDELKTMSEKAADFNMPDAAGFIVNESYRIIEGTQDV